MTTTPPPAPKSACHAPAKWTPLHLELVIHYCVSIAPYPQHYAPAVRDYSKQLVAEGYLMETGGDSLYTGTEKGQQLLALLCRTDLPRACGKPCDAEVTPVGAHPSLRQDGPIAETTAVAHAQPTPPPTPSAEELAQKLHDHARFDDADSLSREARGLLFQTDTELRRLAAVERAAKAIVPPGVMAACMAAPTADATARADVNHAAKLREMAYWLLANYEHVDSRVSDLRAVADDLERTAAATKELQEKLATIEDEVTKAFPWRSVWLGEKSRAEKAEADLRAMTEKRNQLGEAFAAMTKERAAVSQEARQWRIWQTDIVRDKTAQLTASTALVEKLKVTLQHALDEAESIEASERFGGNPVKLREATIARAAVQGVVLEALAITADRQGGDGK